MRISACLVAAATLLGCKNDGMMVSAPADDKRVITMSPFTVGPGQEIYKCQTFVNPFGADAEIATFHSSMSVGSHHLLVLYQENAVASDLTDCSGLTFGPMPYAAQQPESEISYPTGIAALVKSTQGLRLVAHYLNATTTETIHATVQVTLSRAPAGSVTQHAGVIFLNNVGALLPGTGGVPPYTVKTISADWTTPAPMSLLYAFGHMHQRTQSLTATYNGTMLYTSDSWDNAPLQHYQPALQLPAGTTITWSCTINNDTGGTLVFGESAQTDEMCIFNGQYYPAVSDANPSILFMR
jgi:hypothetical protein